MKRTQLYVDDELWHALHAQARAQRTSVSELVRQAARQKYLGDWEKRKQAMQAFVGIWKDRPEFRDPEAYVRRLRRGTRLRRLKNP
jgi:hypothetical protein